MSNIENNICSAIDIIVQKAISEAAYDKTIQATVVSCEDASIGKYSVKYQDSKFYAYSTSTDVTYTSGSTVYVLIPGNNTSKDKTILGTTKKLGLNYVSTIENDQAYEITGKNCISPTEVIRMSSYREGTYSKVLYSKDNEYDDNIIQLDEIAANEYIKSSSNLICGAQFRTTLPAEQQYRGNYGIIFALDFNDNTNNEVITRYYTIDVDKMSGNPYKLTKSTRQYGIFDIDNENFIEVNYIAVFTYDFPNSKPENELTDDIFIKEIELCGANRLSDDDISNYSLVLATPQGRYFDDSALDSDVRTLKAEVRVKGNVITDDSDLSFYWFIEHVGISSNSQYYNKYGGQGWKCLNSFNIIQSETEDQSAIVEWIKGSSSLSVKKTDVIAKENKYKCVVVYDSTVLSKTISIKNLSSAYDITIESDCGTHFYYDIGFPTLTCLVGGQQSDEYTYSWGVTDNTGSFQSLVETADVNADYQDAYDLYHSLLSLVESEQVPYAPNKDRLLELQYALEAFDKVTRVDGNVIYHMNVNTITSFSTYHCSVFKSDVYIGTASIVITNSLTTEGTYSLVINNGANVYKYNENGISPASGSLDSPIEIPALTFTIYDNLGNAIDDEVARHCDIQWIVPSSNTMIKVPNSYEPATATDGSNIYKNLMSFSYEIANSYNFNYNRNNIQLIVDYKGASLAATTNFTFIKEGESGTNGTEFTCKIVANTPSGTEAPMYPTITQYANGSWSLNYTPINDGYFFRAQLWHNEEKVLDSVSSGTSTEGKTATITWSILKNKYTASVSDESSFNVDSSTGLFTFKGYNTSSPANIVKVTIVYDGITYYATLPVITVRLRDNDYRLNLKEGTGFRYVIYTSDGQTPKYDNSNPFEVTVTQNLGDGYYEDVSTKTSSTYAVSYYWDLLGVIYEDKEWVIDCNLNEKSVDGLALNQKSVKPLDDFDGQCVTNAVECMVYKTGIEVARIHIPVHLLLNRYGNSAINGWDGNSVQVDADGGFILAPQVGAGVKESDNSFTGILMGKVKETNQVGTDVGLFGYAKGQRTIFLDAETGKAEFGVSSKGQLIIDPSNNKAQIKSGNYSTSNKTGMLIDFTTPEIKYGSGNFAVSSEGYLTAKGGGSIAGWSISDTKLSKGNVGMSSDNSSSSNKAFWAGSKYSVDFDGNLTAQDANIKGTIYATSGELGSGSNKITIGRSGSSYSAIYSGSKNGFDTNATGFYLGTNGFALGTRVQYTSDNNNYHSKFEVSSSGQMYVQGGHIEGAIYATSGTFTNLTAIGEIKCTMSDAGSDYALLSYDSRGYPILSAYGATIYGSIQIQDGWGGNEAKITVGGAEVSLDGHTHSEYCSSTVPTSSRTSTTTSPNYKALATMIDNIKSWAEGKFEPKSS